jgi:hypothetical protein
VSCVGSGPPFRRWQQARRACRHGDIPDTERQRDRCLHRCPGTPHSRSRRRPARSQRADRLAPTPSQTSRVILSVQLLIIISQIRVSRPKMRLSQGNSVDAAGRNDQSRSCRRTLAQRLGCEPSEIPRPRYSLAVAFRGSIVTGHGRGRAGPVPPARAVVEDVSVDHRRARFIVTQQLLNRADITPILEQMGGNEQRKVSGVAARRRSDIRSEPAALSGERRWRRPSPPPAYRGRWSSRDPEAGNDRSSRRWPADRGR